jgi:cell wall assembly regulator SMI1
MKQYWKRFENWLIINAPNLLLQLNEGATQADIDKLETIIHKKLPVDFVDFYKIHNGQDYTTEALIKAELLLSVNGVIDQWQCWESLLDQFEKYGNTSDPDKGIKNNWWNSLWIHSHRMVVAIIFVLI